MNSCYDVVIIGGAFSGATAGILCKRRNPSLRVLIIEKSLEFDRKVGESTAEISGCFLSRVLGLANYMGHEHLPKFGLRMWFTRDENDLFDDCVEVGARYQTRLASYQVDRSKLDEHLLAMAIELGCEVKRPAKVSNLVLGGIGKNSMTVTENGESEQVTGRWVVDASGRVAMVARQLEVLKPLDAHKTNAVWARFRGVKDWDGVEMAEQHPCYANACRTARSWATNHLMGYGWWCWIIPLKGGDHSIGIVYDNRLFSLPEGASIPNRIKDHILKHPVGREMFAEIEPVGKDARAYANMSYHCEQVFGDGWGSVGDAAGFMDPLYSPGLDFCCYSVSAVVDVIFQELDGEDIGDAINQHNRQFKLAFHTWFEALYKDKYYYLGDADLMSAALLMDVGTYFIGPVRIVYDNPATQFTRLPFQGAAGKLFGMFMKFYNHRLAALAKRRIADGTYGMNNHGWRELYEGFSPEFSVGKLLLKGVGKWLMAEIKTPFMKPPIKMDPEKETVPETIAAPAEIG